MRLVVQPDAGLRRKLRGQHATESVSRRRLTLGLTDATTGGAISWAIGPGQVAGGIAVAGWIVTAVFVVSIAAVVAAVGGVAGRVRGFP